MGVSLIVRLTNLGRNCILLQVIWDVGQGGLMLWRWAVNYLNPEEMPALMLLKMTGINRFLYLKRKKETIMSWGIPSVHRRLVAFPQIVHLQQTIVP